MRAAQTLERNIAMCYAVQMGASLAEVARTWEVKPSSVRSSVKRMQSHVLCFVQKFPEELSSKDPRHHAYKAFAEHVGAKIKLAKPKAKDVVQASLF